MKTTLPNRYVSRQILPVFLGRAVTVIMGGLALVSQDSFGAVPNGPTLDETRTEYALSISAPVIDGEINVANPDEWRFAAGNSDYWHIYPDTSGLAADGLRGGAVGVGTPPADLDDLSVKIFAGFDTNYLYVAVRVRDSLIQNDSAAADSANGNTWEDDSVEVFVDGANANALTWAAGQVGGQFVIAANNAYREAEAGNPGYGENAAWYARTAPLADGTGYEAEFRISLATLGNPKPGAVLGFTVAVNDDDDGGPRERQVIWMGTAHQPVTYGNLVLGAQSYAAPKVTTAPNPDGRVNAGEYGDAPEIRVNAQTGVVYLPGADDDLPLTDLDYKVYVVHDTNAVYLAFDVIDEKISWDSAGDVQAPGLTTWDDDSVEIFFDLDNSKAFGGGTTLGGGVFEGQYTLTPIGTYFDGSPSTEAKKGEHWFAAASTTATGYQIEFKILKTTLGNPEDNAPIGFHIAINDDDQVGDYSHIGWTGQAHHEYTYGTLMLAGAPGANVPPTVAMTAPANAASFNAPASITVTATASDTDGSISKVEFFAGTNLIGTATTSPYTITWNNVVAGGYALTAKATDNQGGTKVSTAVSVIVSSGGGPGAWELLENFEQLTLGDLNGQQGWSASLAQVAADPADAANQVASFEGAADGGANRPVLVPQGATATLFYRFRSEVEDPNLRDWWAGLSDVPVSGLGAFGDFEAQIGLTGDAAALRVRDGVIANNVDADEHLPLTWYKIWAVVNNATDRYEVYVQGGSRTQQTQIDIDSTSATSFVFRNSGAAPAANDLIRFLVKSGSGARPGPVLLDDIYLATGKNLTDPTSSSGAGLRIAEIKPDLASGNITLRWDGGNGQFQVEKAANVTGPWQVEGAVQTGNTLTVPGVLRTSNRSFYRVHQLSAP